MHRSFLGGKNLSKIIFAACMLPFKASSSTFLQIFSKEPSKRASAAKVDLFRAPLGFPFGLPENPFLIFPFGLYFS